MEIIPILLFWSAAGWAMFQPKRALLYLYFAAVPFGSFAAIPTELTAGLTLTPATIAASLLILRHLSSSRGMDEAVRAATRPSGLLLLLLFWIVAVVVTLFMPRLFAGAVEIVPVRFGASVDTAMLTPTMQNLSQLAYMSISVLVIFVFAEMLRVETNREHAVRALCVGAALTILTGILDFSSIYVPIEPVLEPFRTASYALRTDDEVDAVRRVVGLMPEASSFGTLALTFLATLYFFRRAVVSRWLRDRAIPVMCGALLVLVGLSTSSAAYVGLACFGIAAAGDWLWRLILPARNRLLKRNLAKELWVVLAAVAFLLFVVIGFPRLLSPVQDMIDVMVLQKSSSSSFEERSMWTRVSWHALWATYGLGVGLGGTRASNFAVALTSNVGVAGAGLLLLFTVQTLIARHMRLDDSRAQALLSATRWSYVAPLCSSLLIGSTPELGFLNPFLLGMASALARPVLRLKKFPAVTPNAFRKSAVARTSTDKGLREIYGD